MPRRADEDDLVVRERLEPHRSVAGRGADDAELQAPLRDKLDDHARVVHLERDANSRVGALELAEEPWHDDRGRAGRRAHRERAGEVSVAFRRHLVEHLLLEREEPLRAAVEARTRLGRLDTPARPVEKLGAEPLLERAHLERDGRLRDAELLRRL